MPIGKTYAPELKEQAAKWVIDNLLPIARVTRQVGINGTILGFWMKD